MEINKQNHVNLIKYTSFRLKTFKYQSKRIYFLKKEVQQQETNSNATKLNDFIKWF